MSVARTTIVDGRTRSGLARLLAVDALRGMLIVVMALDHASHFVAQKHSTGEYWGFSFPTYSQALPFLTRLVTHIAAPGFFLLMGLGMLLLARSRQKQGWSRRQILRHFWIRGALLIALQLLVVNRAWELSPGGWGLDIYIGVLFALGGTMILGSLVLWLRPRHLIILLVLLVVGTELLHQVPVLWTGFQTDPLILLLVRPGGDPSLWSNYPLLPWLELVVFGLLFGHWLKENDKQAFRRGLVLGLLFLVVFLILRWMDGFGNIRPRAGDGWIDFLNVVKYPPSLSFTLLTTGVNLVLLWVYSKLAGFAEFILEPLAVFGRAPLFFYILHLFLFASIGILITPRGTSIAAMYPFWLLGLIVLYPWSYWFGKFKHGRPANSPIRFI
jgi:uncharacterized membrane protein